MKSILELDKQFKKKRKPIKIKGGKHIGFGRKER